MAWERSRWTNRRRMWRQFFGAYETREVSGHGQDGINGYSDPNLLVRKYRDVYRWLLDDVWLT